MRFTTFVCLAFLAVYVCADSGHSVNPSFHHDHNDYHPKGKLCFNKAFCGEKGEPTVSSTKGGYHHVSCFFVSTSLCKKGKEHNFDITFLLPPTFPKELLHLVDPCTTEGLLRGLIFAADFECVADVLTSTRNFGLAAGITYPVNIAPFVEDRSDRNLDPDVIAFKGIALAAANGDAALTFKVSTNAVQSLENEHFCSFGRRLMGSMRSLFSARTNNNNSGRKDNQVNSLNLNFNNKPRAEGYARRNAANDGGGKKRLLLHASEPVKSAFCDKCWPPEVCNIFDGCPIAEPSPKPKPQRYHD